MAENSWMGEVKWRASALARKGPVTGAVSRMKNAKRNGFMAKDFSLVIYRMSNVALQFSQVFMRAMMLMTRDESPMFTLYFMSHNRSSLLPKPLATNGQTRFRIYEDGPDQTGANYAKNVTEPERCVAQLFIIYCNVFQGYIWMSKC